MTGENVGCIIYGRVSTTSQELDGQVRELEQEAARRGLTVAARHLEKASATGRIERAEYDRLLRDAADPPPPVDPSSLLGARPVQP